MLKDENTRLRVLAEHDWLTGLYNRRAAEAHVDEALLKNGGGMLLVLDIDHFKQVNDRYGHLIGDALLCEAARTLRDIFFPRDIIGRVGGDEFIIYILGGCSQEAVDGRAVVVLSSNRYLSQITLLRGQTVELIFGSSSGLRIPKAALRMVTQESTDPETGETVQTNLVGVYTLVGGRAEFKPVEILTEESDFYVVSPATEGRAVLRAGDEVIVRATGLYDGKLLNF